MVAEVDIDEFIFPKKHNKITKVSELKSALIIYFACLARRH
jgi:hypothetical protein